MADTDDLGPVIEITGTKIYYFPEQNIGLGATSMVYQGYFGNSKLKVAVKKIEPEFTDVHENELKIWQHLLKVKTDSNVNVVRLFDWTKVNKKDLIKGLKTSYVFAMELANCNLREYVHSNLQANLNALKSICQDAAKGLHFLHKNDILHRDLKPENVLLFIKGNIIVAKLGDFGVSRLMTNHTSTNATGRGTEVWMSPEAIKSMHKGETFKNTTYMDIFSLGMTIYFTLSRGKHPFEKSSKYLSFPLMNITDPDLQPPLLYNLPLHNENSLLLWMMTKEQSKRPNIHQVLNHPTFWDSRKCLKFLCSLTRAISDQANKKVCHIINNKYKSFYETTSQTKFDWFCIVDQRLLRRVSKGKKVYTKDSLLSLLELIRDKREHYNDMLPNLRNERFNGENGKFSEFKYAEYFLKFFPEIIGFLFEILVQENELFGSLEEDYFQDYKTVHFQAMSTHPLCCNTEGSTYDSASERDNLNWTAQREPIGLDILPTIKNIALFLFGKYCEKYPNSGNFILKTFRFTQYCLNPFIQELQLLGQLVLYGFFIYLLFEIIFRLQSFQTTIRFSYSNSQDYSTSLPNTSFKVHSVLNGSPELTTIDVCALWLSFFLITIHADKSKYWAPVENMFNSIRHQNRNTPILAKQRFKFYEYTLFYILKFIARFLMCSLVIFLLLYVIVDLAINTISHRVLPFAVEVHTEKLMDMNEKIRIREARLE